MGQDRVVGTAIKGFELHLIITGVLTINGSEVKKIYQKEGIYARSGRIYPPEPLFIGKYYEMRLLCYNFAYFFSRVLHI